jgi:hypothetical protein
MVEGSDASPPVHAPTVEYAAHRPEIFGHDRSGGAPASGTNRFILAVMFAREAIQIGRTVGGDTPVEFEIVRSRNPQDPEPTGTYLAQQPVEDA